MQVVKEVLNQSMSDILGIKKIFYQPRDVPVLYICHLIHYHYFFCLKQLP